jgi:hypothetical protein
MRPELRRYVRVYRAIPTKAEFRRQTLIECRANGCTCDPDIDVPDVEVGKFRVANVSHDNDCPHYRDPDTPAIREFIRRNNAGEYDDD